jgi:endonuclease/exonuclease/phosphatase (EEP) superfamily protein YafD
MHSAFLPVGDPLRGVAVLSRWPLSSPSGVTVASLGSESAALRVELQTVLVEQPIIIVAAQLRAAEDEQRVQQAAVLLELIADASLVLLGADLGAPPQDMVYQQLISEGFSDPDQVLGIEQGYTTPAVYPTVRHDYVLVRGLTPLDARQVDSAASDHRLVVVEFGLPGS